MGSLQSKVETRTAEIERQFWTSSKIRIIIHNNQANTDCIKHHINSDNRQ